MIFWGAHVLRDDEAGHAYARCALTGHCMLGAQGARAYHQERGWLAPAVAGAAAAVLY